MIHSGPSQMIHFGRLLNVCYLFKIEPACGDRRMGQRTLCEFLGLCLLTSPLSQAASKQASQAGPRSLPLGLSVSLRTHDSSHRPFHNADGRLPSGTRRGQAPSSNHFAVLQTRRDHHICPDQLMNRPGPLAWRLELDSGIEDSDTP